MSTELYELSVQGLHQAEYVENVLHFVGDNLIANDTMQNGLNLIDSFNSSIKSFWLGCLPTKYTLARLAARRVIPVGSGIAHLQNAFGSNAGTLGSNCASYQLCPSVFLVPPTGTKSGGRIFMPCIASSMVDSNVYNATYVTAIDDLMGQLTQTFGTSGQTWQLAILSRKNQTYAPALAWELSTRFGFQKRRRSPIGA